MQVTADTGQGLITGLSDGGINCFKGIPYALPPVGERRFYPPEPVRQCGLVTDATRFGPAALQPERIGSHSSERMISPFTVSEDCLYLNIWAPANKPDSAGYPVLVWLHGGSAMYGSASQPVYNGDALARQGIVVVTVNYRLGCLGFLELGAVLGDAFYGSGNNAHRDQLLALQWVQDNIFAFNGDASRVTVAGESSGAKSVAALLSVEQSNGLFHGAISASGGGQCVHSLPEANNVTAIFLQHLEQLSGNDCPLQANGQQLMEAQLRTVVDYGFLFPFRTVLDGDFLQSSPQTVISQRPSHTVPLLAGFNQHDGYFQLPVNNAPVKLSLCKQDALPLVIQQIHRQQPDYPLVDILSDLEYILPTMDLADAHSAGAAGTFLYQFNILQTEGIYRGFCVHASDVPYIWRNFNDPYMRSFAPLNADHCPGGRLLMQAWVNFIKYRDPLFLDKTGGDDYWRQSQSLNNDGFSSLEDVISAKRNIWSFARHMADGPV